MTGDVDPFVFGNQPRGTGRASAVFPALALALLLVPGVSRAGSIASSKHNLSVTGKGNLKAATETEICIFCHTPHNTSLDAPLWNRKESGRQYVPYGSSTSKASHGQPTGTSKVCLSCHDGTVALGQLKSRPKGVKFKSGAEKIPSGKGNIGTDLRDDHPISFVYDHELAKRTKHQVLEPDSIKGSVRLDKGGQMQCTSCHDPHDDRNGKFLVEENKKSKLCVACHAIDGWGRSAHGASTARWNGRSPDPWPDNEFETVADNACQNCHSPHNAGGKTRLMRAAKDEDNCYPCHNGNVARRDVEAAFGKSSVHPIAASRGIHDPVEDLKNPRRHVACADCHSPHAVRGGESARAPDAPGSIAGVRGVTSEGGEAEPVTREYELCFRCHADSAKRGPSRVSRVSVETNTRLEFSPSNPSYHPVVARGKNNNVPSLVASYKTTSLIYCTDCHNNDQGTKEGGEGASGPHGSSFAPILARRLVLTDSFPESASAYALCYKCHSRESLLKDESFPQHSTHIAIAACTTCHDSHGSADSPHLINFNRDYVSSYRGEIAYTSDGQFKGSCTLSCHKRDHDKQSYGIPVVDLSGTTNTLKRIKPRTGTGGRRSRE